MFHVKPGASSDEECPTGGHCSALILLRGVCLSRRSAHRTDNPSTPGFDMRTPFSPTPWMYSQPETFLTALLEVERVFYERCRFCNHALNGQKWVVSRETFSIPLLPPEPLIPHPVYPYSG